MNIDPRLFNFLSPLYNTIDNQDRTCAFTGYVPINYFSG